MTYHNPWWKKAVIYQVYPRSFMDSNGDGIGDIRGIIARLDHIKSLGVDALWISPMYLSPGKDNGYDIADYRQIDTAFGSNEDMEALIAEAHQRGIKIIMDMVANHTSDQHAWFQASKKSRDNRYSDYYIWKDAKPDGTPPNNWGSHFGGSAWAWCEERQQYYLHYYAKEQPDLNWENPTVRQEIYDIMTYWAKKGIDGWRMDVVTEISKYTDFAEYVVDHNLPVVGWMHANGPRVHEFIREMHHHALAPYQMMTVGEAQGSTTDLALSYIEESAEQLDMLFTFEHMDVDVEPGTLNRKWQLREFSLPRLKAIMAKWQNALYGRGWNTLYWENHDRPRIISRWGNDDEYRYECATAWATVLHGMQGTPFIYQGEEIGMTNIKLPLHEYRDIEIKNNYNELVVKQKTLSHEDFMQAVWQTGRDNARTPMQWSSEPHAGFTTGTPWFGVNPAFKEINVEQDSHSEKSIFRFYQKLIQLRHSDELLTDGKFVLLQAEHPTIFAYQRILNDRMWIVVANLCAQSQALPDDVVLQGGKIIISNYAARMPGETLLPYEAVIVEFACHH